MEAPHRHQTGAHRRAAQNQALLSRSTYALLALGQHDTIHWQHCRSHQTCSAQGEALRYTHLHDGHG
ncbi:ectonucleoside triphosphate diphosphohydrolase 3, partial [Biomphalaria glabrata]